MSVVYFVSYTGIPNYTSVRRCAACYPGRETGGDYCLGRSNTDGWITHDWDIDFQRQPERLHTRLATLQIFQLALFKHVRILELCSFTGPLPTSRHLSSRNSSVAVSCGILISPNLSYHHTPLSSTRRLPCRPSSCSTSRHGAV